MVKKPLHIAYIGQKGAPALWGGVERATEELAVRMAAAGYFVTVYCRTWYAKHQPLFYRNVRLKYVPSVHTKYLDAITHTFFSVVNAMWNGVDVIHFQGIGPALLAWIPRMFAPHTRVLVTFHCLDRKLQKWNWFARLMFYVGEYVAISCSHEMFVTSRALEQYVLHTWNHRATYLPNGAFERTIAFDSTEDIRAFGLTPHRYVVCVGRLMRDKAQHEVIAAFVRAKERLDDASCADLKLVIVGDSADAHDSYRAYLNEQIAGRDDVVFLGVQTGSILKSLIKHARVGVSLSYSEGMPLAVLEMASYGVPLVVSDITAHREIFGDDHAFIEVGNVERAAVQLARLVKNFDEIRVIAAIIAERIAARYCWDIIVARYCVSIVSVQTEFEREHVVLQARLV